MYIYNILLHESEIKQAKKLKLSALISSNTNTHYRYNWQQNRYESVFICYTILERAGDFRQFFLMKLNENWLEIIWF